MGGAGAVGVPVTTALRDVRGERLVVLLETPRTGAGFDVASAALARGYTPVVLMQRPEAIDNFIIETYERLGAVVVRWPTDSTEEVVRAARELAERNDVAALLCAYEYYTVRAAQAARSLGLRGPDPDSVRTCRSKSRLRAALSVQPGLNPPYSIVDSPAGAVTAARALGFPVVLKPANLTGSVYVKRCDDEAAVGDMARKILALGSYLGMVVEPVVIVERYIDGPEFSVEALDGRAIGATAKQTSSPPFFVELGHTYPAPSPPSVTAAVCAAAESALHLVRLDTGPAHVEVKLDQASGEVMVIEVNPRLGGGRIPELVRLAQGISLSGAHLDALLDRAVDLRPTRAQVAVIRFVPTPAKGRLVRLDGLDAAAELEGVAEVALEPEVGGDYFANGSNRDRLVHVIAVAEDADGAHAIARKAIERLTIEWSDVPGELRYP